jgi:hypothetical protein
MLRACRLYAETSIYPQSNLRHLSTRRTRILSCIPRLTDETSEVLAMQEQHGECVCAGGAESDNHGDNIDICPVSRHKYAPCRVTASDREKQSGSPSMGKAFPLSTRQLYSRPAPPLHLPTHVQNGSRRNHAVRYMPLSSSTSPSRERGPCWRAHPLACAPRTRGSDGAACAGWRRRRTARGGQSHHRCPSRSPPRPRRRSSHVQSAPSAWRRTRARAQTPQLDRAVGRAAHDEVAAHRDALDGRAAVLQLAGGGERVRVPQA